MLQKDGFGPEGRRFEIGYHVVGLVHVAFIEGELSSHWCGGVSLEGVWVPDQVSSTSSEHSSKLRGLSQSSPRGASNRDVSLTKLPR
ncbi:hypothetical protein AVEN_239598-1 [Araneus ventricosus]|uniref:Uncharacterized protein n=1 Tax=Araneus ventricosus TaxID=182803 RepID=A0A4Y2QV11_ARAVE|nr:hypothetical protein AVEN_239598-1 [Araneus ventricosus]